MKKVLYTLFLVSALFSKSYQANAWGVYGHFKINRGAILALPKEMGIFYYNHADFITEESVCPDLRKYTIGDKVEFPRHYIDLEKFDYSTSKSMPHSLDEAYKKYTKDSVDKYGSLPWTIQEVMEKLTKAMKEKSRPDILFLSANLGHYIADAHMPLHTTENHDGQLTGQKGIHGLWECQLPELFGKNYSYYAEPHYIDNIEKETWSIIDSSHKLINELLYNDKKLRKDKPQEMLYKIGANGQPEKNRWGALIYSYEYCHVYHELLQGMVEKRMRAAIEELSSYWYTAWVNAGKPNLSDIDPKYLTERNHKFYEEDMSYWKKGKVTGYKIANDY